MTEAAMALPRARERAPLPGFYAAAFVVLTLHSYYLGAAESGVRIFDFMSIGLVGLTALGLAATRGPGVLGLFTLPSTRWLLAACFVLLFVVAALVGVMWDPQNTRPTVGIFLGVFAWAAFYFTPFSRVGLERVVTITIIVHAAALFLQTVVYYAIGTVLNYHALVGRAPGALSLIFRPTGLFVEPSQYSVAMMMLVTIRLRLTHGFDRLTWWALFSILTTISLYGFVAVIVLVGWHFSRRAWFWPTAALLFLGMTQLKRLPIPFFQREAFVVSRITSIVTGSGMKRDASLQSRFGGLQSGESALASWPTWFGYGVSRTFANRFGANGLSNLVSMLGLMGATVLFIVMAALSPPGGRRFTLFSLLLLMISAPIWTTLFWWAWMALLTNHSLSRPPPLDA